MFYSSYGERRRSSLSCGLSLTKQSFKDECDVNNILRKAQQTGLIGRVNSAQAAYGDVSGISDFKSAVDFINSAQAGFEDLPSDVRRKFNNDPGALISFLAEPNNRAEAQKLGLVKLDDSVSPPEAKPKASSAASKAADDATNEPPLI